MKLPRALATQGARGSGMVRANPAAQTNTGPAGQGVIAAGRAIAGAGEEMFKIQQHKQKISDDTEVDRINQNISEWDLTRSDAHSKMRVETAGGGDSDQAMLHKKYKEDYNKFVSSEIKNVNSRVQDRIKSSSAKYFTSANEREWKASSAKFAEHTIVAKLKIAGARATEGDIDGANEEVDYLLREGLIGPKRAAISKNSILESYKVGTINSSKPIIEQSLIASNFSMKEANETIDKSVALMEKEGVLGKVEAAEARKELSNWAADVAAQRKRVDNENLIQTYSGLADELAEGTFTGDSIILSKLSKTRIVDDGWASIREGARKDPPTTNTSAGTNKITETLYDYSMGKIGKKEALLNLMQERFSEGSVKHDFYKKALDRIETGYPDDVAKVMKKMMDEAENILYHKGAGVFFGKDFLDPSEKTKLAEVKVGLFNWVESESKDGKYPSGDEMYKKVRELGISVKTPEALKVNIPTKPPLKTDITYDPSDEDYDSLPSGTLIFDSIAGRYRRKP